MNFLFIAPSDPRNTDNGGNQRTHFLYQALTNIGTVYTVIPVFAKSLEHIDEENKIAMLCIEKRYSTAWFINHCLNRFIPIILWHPYGGLGYFDSIWKNVKFDFTVCRYTKWAAYAKAWKIAPLLLDIDDLPEEAYKTIYLKRGIGGALICKLVRKWSNYIFNKSAGLWIANPSQVLNLSHKNASFLPNISLPQTQTETSDSSDRIIFSVGCLAYPPNYLGIDFFINHVWQHLHERFPDLTYHIAGKDLPEQYQKSWSRIPGIKLLGFVRDLHDEYKHCLFTVAPIFAGSGTCIKVLESLAYHRCCLCSTFAARGLESTGLDHAGLLLADTAEQFYHQAVELIENESRRKELQTRGADLVEKLFHFQKFKEQIHKVLEKAQFSLRQENNDEDV